MLGVCPKVAHVPSGLTEVMTLGHEAVGDNRERSQIYLGKRCANRSSWFIGVPNACAKCSQLFREQRCAQQPQMLGKCTTRMQYLTTLSRSSGKCQPFMHAKKSLKLRLFSLYLRPSLVCVVVSFMCCVFLQCCKYNFSTSSSLFSKFCLLQSFRAAPVGLRIWPSKIKMNEEKSKHAVLAQENDFGPTFFHRMSR